MNPMLCPFCGIVCDVPHETQEVCIDALHDEIDRTRRVLRDVTEPLPPPRVAVDEDSPAL